MQKRLIFLTLLNIIVILISLGIISFLRVNDSIHRSLEDRLDVASIIGKYIDRILESNLKRLYDISISGKIDFHDNDWEPEKKALKTAYDYSIFTDRIFLLDLYGNVVITYPHREGKKMNLTGIPYIGRALSGKRQVISDVYTIEPTKRKVIFTLVPLKNKDGEIIGVAGGEVNPANYIFTQIVKSIPVKTDTYIELVDSLGTIIASNDPVRVFTCTDHNKFLGRLIADKKPSVATCHRCHLNDKSGKGRTKDIIAFSPLSLAPWGIAIREPEASVFLPSEKLKRDFLILGLIAVSAALILSVGMSRSIVRPIQLLTKASKKMGRGYLFEPVRINRRDEIGMLAQSFEKMRGRVAELLDSVQKSNIELENRVSTRTQELERSRAKLSGLLKQVITAQEDERKRIARELHDETSQSLVALGMSIDIAAMALEENSLSREDIYELKQKLNDVLDGINLLIRDLRPPVLDDLGLESGIRWLLETHLAGKGINCFLMANERFRRMIANNRYTDVAGNRTELILFRVVQEAVINIARHADASEVSVFLCANSSHINIGIEDNGKGFEVTEVMESTDRGRNTGFGILGMKERISLLDGEFFICSKPGEGTFITVEVPVSSVGSNDV